MAVAADSFRHLWAGPSDEGAICGSTWNDAVSFFQGAQDLAGPEDSHCAWNPAAEDFVPLGVLKK